MAELDFIEIVANGLKEHCEDWGHNDDLRKLKQDSSVKNFRRLFLKITHLYYISHQGDCYNVTFDKKEDIAAVKRCGADWDKRGIDAIIEVGELIEALVS